MITAIKVAFKYNLIPFCSSILILIRRAENIMSLNLHFDITDCGLKQKPI